jgi:transposase
MAQRLKFSKEFKPETVNLIATRGVSLVQASRDLGFGANILGCWMRKFKQSDHKSLSGHGVQKPDNIELVRLHREVAQIKMERNSLKKVAAFFAKVLM